MKRKKDLMMHVRLGMSVLLLIGAWLVVASMTLSYGSGNAAINNTIMGFLLIILALIAMRAPLDSSPICWITGAIGVWLICSPFVLGYTDQILVMANNLWIGIITVLLSAFVSGEAQGLNQGLEAH